MEDEGERGDDDEGGAVMPTAREEERERGNSKVREAGRDTRRSHWREGRKLTWGRT